MFDAALFKGQERNTLRLWEIQYVSCLWEDRKGDLRPFENSVWWLSCIYSWTATVCLSHEPDWNLLPTIRPLCVCRRRLTRSSPPTRSAASLFTTWPLTPSGRDRAFPGGRLRPGECVLSAPAWHCAITLKIDSPYHGKHTLKTSLSATSSLKYQSHLAEVLCQFLGEIFPQYFKVTSLIVCWRLQWLPPFAGFFRHRKVWIINHKTFIM